MSRLVLVLATDRGESEDGSVNYSSYYLVSSDTLAFDEPIFQQHSLSQAQFFENPEEAEEYDQSQDPNGWDAPAVSTQKVLDHLRNLGYTVERTNTHVLWASSYGS